MKPPAAPSLFCLNSHRTRVQWCQNEFCARLLNRRFQVLPSQRNYLNRPTFALMTILPRKGLLAIAVVVDVALQTDGRPISAKTLATRHGLPRAIWNWCPNHWCAAASSRRFDGTGQICHIDWLEQDFGNLKADADFESELFSSGPRATSCKSRGSSA
jgi:hypothetical protein